MNTVAPSTAAFAQYLRGKCNTQIHDWVNKMSANLTRIKNNGVPQWVKKWPRVHKIVGPLVTSMHLIMMAAAIVSASALALSPSAGWVVLGIICLFTAVITLPFVATNKREWSDIKYDWGRWEKDANDVIKTLKILDLQHERVEQIVSQILELRNGPINSYQKIDIDMFIPTLKNFAANYKKQTEEYILHTVENMEEITVDVQTSSILDNFGQAVGNNLLPKEELSRAYAFSEKKVNLYTI